MSNDSSPFSGDAGWRFLEESGSVVVLRVGPDGTILAANRHARTLIGEPLLGLPWDAILLHVARRMPLEEWLADPARPRLLNILTTCGMAQTLQVAVEMDGGDYLLFGELNAAEQARLGQEVLELNHDLSNLSRELALKNDDHARLNTVLTRQKTDLEEVLARARRLDDELRIHESRYRTVVETSRDGFWVVDTEGCLRDVNEAYVRRSGYTREELLEMHVFDLDAKETEADAAAHIRRIISKGGDVFETLHQAKDGTLWPVEISAHYRASESEGVLCFLRDITERKRAISELHESESRYRRLIESSPDIVYVFSNQRGGIFYSSRVEALLGYHPDYLYAHPFLWRDSIHTEDIPKVKRAVESSESSKPFAVEYRIKDAQGQWRWFLDRSTEVRAANGESLIEGLVTDITERKKEEEFRNKLTDQVPGVIYQYRLYPDGRSCFPYSSSGMNSIYEVTPEEVREDATPVFKRLHPEDLESTAAAIYDSARTLALFHCEFRVVLPRQGLRWRMCDATPERMPDGGTLWYGIITDITERKQVEKEKAVLEAQFQQAQKMESVGRLAGGVAHDFNNMLTVIRGNVALAIEQVDAAQPIYTDLVEIRKAADRSADLTRQLLAFARKQVIAPKVLNLNETVPGILNMLQRLIGEDISLKWHPGANPSLVKIDPSQIDQILANLCINARDAIAGVGNIIIETGSSTFDEDYCAVHAGFTPGDYVRLAVSDNGHGIEKETLAHIFEPFFTTKGAGEGTGLGLATVYGAVKQNNGFINVFSEPDTGTTFTIYLPRHEGGPEQDSAAGAASTHVRGQETILLVEDEPSILKLTTRVLTRQGYAVLAANTPGEAIRLASEHASAIHLLMTDVVMPEMNGRDLAKILQSRSPGLKLLFMSGYTANIIVHQGVLDQGVQFIQKPFSIDDLAAKVREVLDSA